MNLYPEMPKESFSEHGVRWSNEQGATPGPERRLAPMARARGQTQVFARHDHQYHPERVDPGLRGPGGRPRFDEYPLQDEEGRRFGRSQLPIASVQRTFTHARDLVPGSLSKLSPAVQSYERGNVRPESSIQGDTQRVLSEHAALKNMRGAQSGRLRGEDAVRERPTLGVNGLGELEPRMGTWGHELKNHQAQWASEEARRLPRGQRYVATQVEPDSGLGEVMRAAVRGLGGLGGRGASLAAFWNSMVAAINDALGKGDTDTAYLVAGKSPWTPAPLRVQVAAGMIQPATRQQLDKIIASAQRGGTGFPGYVSLPDPASAERILTQAAAPAGPVSVPNPQASPAVAIQAPQSAPAQVQQQAPQAVQNVVASPQATGMAIAPFATDVSQGASQGAGATAQASPTPAGDASGGSFLTGTVTLPVVGPVPTWAVVLGGFLLLRRRSAS